MTLPLAVWLEMQLIYISCVNWRTPMPLYVKAMTIDRRYKDKVDILILVQVIPFNHKAKLTHPIYEYSDLSFEWYP